MPMPPVDLSVVVGTTAMLDGFREQGYRISSNYLAYLLRERVVPSPAKGPGGAFFWMPADVDVLAAELLRRSRGPACAVCKQRRSSVSQKSRNVWVCGRCGQHGVVLLSAKSAEESPNAPVE